MESTVAVPDPQDRPTLTIPEAARLLGISRSFGYDMARTGALPTIRLGTRWLVPTAALRKMLGLEAAV